MDSDERDEALQMYRGGQVLDAQGEEVKAVWEEQGVRIWYKEIPPLLLHPSVRKPESAETRKRVVDVTSIETPYYQIAWN